MAPRALDEGVQAAQREAGCSVHLESSRSIRPRVRGMAFLTAESLASRMNVLVAIDATRRDSGEYLGLMAVRAARGRVLSEERKAGRTMIKVCWFA